MPLRAQLRRRCSARARARRRRGASSGSRPRASVAASATSSTSPLRGGTRRARPRSRAASCSGWCRGGRRRRRPRRSRSISAHALARPWRAWIAAFWPGRAAADDDQVEVVAVAHCGRPPPARGSRRVLREQRVDVVGVEVERAHRRVGPQRSVLGSSRARRRPGARGGRRGRSICAAVRVPRAPRVGVVVERDRARPRGSGSFQRSARPRPTARVELARAPRAGRAATRASARPSAASSDAASARSACRRRAAGRTGTRSRRCSAARARSRGRRRPTTASGARSRRSDPRGREPGRRGPARRPRARSRRSCASPSRVTACCRTDADVAAERGRSWRRAARGRRAPDRAWRVAAMSPRPTSSLMPPPRSCVATCGSTGRSRLPVATRRSRPPSGRPRARSRRRRRRRRAGEPPAFRVASSKWVPRRTRPVGAEGLARGRVRVGQAVPSVTIVTLGRAGVGAFSSAQNSSTRRDNLIGSRQSFSEGTQRPTGP